MVCGCLATHAVTCGLYTWLRHLGAHILAPGRWDNRIALQRLAAGSFARSVPLLVCDVDLAKLRLGKVVPDMG